jgi:hypothetical protein
VTDGTGRAGFEPPVSATRRLRTRPVGIVPALSGQLDGERSMRCGRGVVTSRADNRCRVAG